MVRMEKHKCKLCSRRFSSGKALGGHMRSHLANFPLPPKTPHKQQELSSSQHPRLGPNDSTESTTSSDGSVSGGVEVVQKELVYGLRQNPKKSLMLVDSQFLDGRRRLTVQDRESETESTRKPTRRRSKRTRRMEKKMKPISTTTTEEEEDVALCLIMLSRDVWSSSTNNITTSISDDSGSNRSQSKKIRIDIADTSSESSSEELELPRNNVVSIENHVMVEKKVGHKCPFCNRVFGSGQALGGHKRSHFLGSSTTLTEFQEGSSTLLMIDLNLPPPPEEEDKDGHQSAS